MSAQSPWRPPQVRATSESPRVQEEIEAPGIRRPSLVLVVVVALLAGLGIGRLVFGAAADDVETDTAALEEATQINGRLERHLARLTDSLDAEESDRDRLVVALAEAFYVDPGAVDGGGPGVGRPGARVRRLVEGSMRAGAAGDAEAFAAFFTEDVMWIFYEGNGGTAKYVFDGREAVVRELEMNGLGTNPRPVGRMVQSGDLVWVRYVEADTSGVAVARITDNRIARQWVVMIGPGDGQR